MLNINFRQFVDNLLTSGSTVCIKAVNSKKEFLVDHTENYFDNYIVHSIGSYSLGYTDYVSITLKELSEDTLYDLCEDNIVELL